MSREPLAGSNAGLADEDPRKDSGRREAATFRNLLDLEVRLLGHQPLGFFDTQVIDPLVERATVLAIDKLTEIGAVERQDLTQVH